MALGEILGATPAWMLRGRESEGGRLFPGDPAAADVFNKLRDHAVVQAGSIQDDDTLKRLTQNGTVVELPSGELRLAEDVSWEDYA